MVSPRVLLTDTNRWPLAARIAMVLRDMGCVVAALCPTPGHPVQDLAGLEHPYRYSGFAPVASLQEAIRDFTPDVIIPFCDRGIQHLHALHSQLGSGNEPAITTLIEKSLGEPDSFPIVSSRCRLLELAAQEGIRTPAAIAWEGRVIPEDRDIPWTFPCVAKIDGTWGGKGVRIVSSRVQFERLVQRGFGGRSAAQLLRQVLLNRGLDWAVFDWRQSRRPVMLQQYVEGRPANCSVVCWQGKVLAGVAVEVLRTSSRTGPATMVRVVAGEEMLAAANSLARRLKLSGFFGLDFVIKTASGEPYLIEMNPRCTPPCHLPFPGGQDLVAAYYQQLAGSQSGLRREAVTQLLIEYASRELVQAQENGASETSPDVLRDLPLQERALLRRIKDPYPKRTMLGRAMDCITRTRSREAGHGRTDRTET